MILTIIILILSLLPVSVHFSAKYLAQVEKNYYSIFVALNVLVLIIGMARIYYLSEYVWDNEKGVAFPLMTLIFMFVQIVLVLIIALIANPLLKWWKSKGASI